MNQPEIATYPGCVLRLYIERTNRVLVQGLQLTCGFWIAR